MVAKTPQTKRDPDEGGEDAAAPRRSTCGMIRPIADMGGYTYGHWRDVHNIVAEAIADIDWDLRLVSESDGAGVILTEIVTNLYQDEIVIADVSGRNPNVMFELGMRMAFQKPAIIITDDETPFTFDISPVKHIKYPRSLRYAAINEFKQDIRSALTGTLDAASRPDYRGYLQQFGKVEITDIGSHSVGVSEIAQDVLEIKRTLSSFMNARPFSNLIKPDLAINSGRWVSKGPTLNRSQPLHKARIAFPRSVTPDMVEEVEAIPGIVRVSGDGAEITLQYGAYGDNDKLDMMTVIDDFARQYKGSVQEI